MHIFTNVKAKYETSIINGFKEIETSIGMLKNVHTPYLEFDKSSYFSCRAGFKPFALFSKSGVRIMSKNFKKTNFIKDPELKYEQRTIKNKLSLLSITKKIDDIFEKIFMKVNEILGKKTFLRFYLRRTLAGCEFGICINLDLKSNDKNFEEKNPYCIIDKDPLLIFTIFVRSLVPVLATILGSLFIYLAIIGKKIAKWFTFPSNVKESLKKIATLVANAFASNVSALIFDKIIAFLENKLENNIQKLKFYDESNATIIKNLKELFDHIIGSDISEKLSKKFGSLFEVKTNWNELTQNFLDPKNILKINCYFLLLIASFIINYRYNKIAIEDYTTA